MHKNALIVVAKQPAPGQTKTRLSPPLTPEDASALYECFLLDTLNQMRHVSDAQKAIAYLPLEARDYFQRFAGDFELVSQNGHDLGSRLDHALSSFLSLGYQHAVIMDSDSPTLPSAYLAQAFDALSNGSDVTLGPCEDGGYYLIGINHPAPRLLREVQMSTPRVTADTIALAEGEGLRVSLLPTWYDVDDADSLVRLMKEIKNSDPGLAVHTGRFLQKFEIQQFMKSGV